MKLSETTDILAFLKKLDYYPINKANKVELKEFLKNFQPKLSLYFGETHHLIKAISEITFSPKSYFLETKEIEGKTAWDLGIKLLKKNLSEIIQESHKVLNLNDTVTLESVILSGIETNYIEFKSTLRWDLKLQKVNEELEKVVLKTVCAFNNSDGGNLFIGVADNGTILGLQDDYYTLNNGLGDRDKFELHLRNILNNAYSKTYVTKHIEILFPKIGNIEICRIKVIKGKMPLFFKVGNSKGQDLKDRFYIRNGNQSVELEKVPELVEYAMRHFV